MLTDENLEQLLRTTLADESAWLTSPPGLSATIRRRNANDRRRLALIAAPVAAAAFAATIVVAYPTVETQGEVTSDPSRIELAGYTFTLPESYGARDGSCELSLPDGATRTGIPGAEGACAVLLEATVIPTWLSGPLPGGVWVVATSYDDPGFVTFTITGKDPATERYLVLAVKQPRAAENDLRVEDLQKILDDGLAAAQGAPS